LNFEYEYVYLTEKDSQVEALCHPDVLAAQYQRKWWPAYNNDTKTAIVPLQGHVLVGLEPHEYDPKLAEFGEESIFVFPEEQKYKPGTFGNVKDIYERAVSHLQKAKKIIIASDFDNEGAALAMNVIKAAGVEDRVERMLEMGSVNPEDLRYSIDNPIDIPYKTMAAAGQSRAFLDWAEGITLSRALSYYLGDKNKVKLNFGGVKTPLVYIVVERDLAFEAHKKTYFWTVSGKVNFNGKEIPFNLKKKTIEDGKEVVIEKFESENEALNSIKELEGVELTLSSLIKQSKTELPPKLYELADLQGDMYSLLKVKPDQTLDAAQKNYDTPIAIQTYPRTDIPYLKDSDYNNVPVILNKLKEAEILNKDLVDKVLSGTIPKRKTTFDNKKVIAHGAIIPTKGGDYKKYFPTLGKIEKEMFIKVSNRYLENLMPLYEYESIKGKTEPIKGIFLEFQETIPLSAGWKEVNNKDILNKIKSYERVIPEDFKKGVTFSILAANPIKKETKPKPRFNMKTLLEGMSKIARLFPDNEEIKKYLGEDGIGTIATRDKILADMFDPEKNKGEPWFVMNEKDQIISTQKARNFIKALPVKLVSPIKRAMLSKELNFVKTGKIDKYELIEKYRNNLKEDVAMIKDIAEKQGPIAAKILDIKTLCKCPFCEDGEILEKPKFYVCSNLKFKKTDDGKFEKSGTCNYQLWKNSLDKLGKPSIRSSEVIKLCEKNELKVSLKSKNTGKAYSKIAIPDPKWGIKVIFD
jgi:DNA topoisomerase-3